MQTLINIPIRSHGNYVQFVNKQAPPISRYRFRNLFVVTGIWKIIAFAESKLFFVHTHTYTIVWTSKDLRLEISNKRNINDTEQDSNGSFAILFVEF